MATPVLLALGGADFESAVVVALQGDRDLSIARRCVDVVDLLAAAATGQARAALVSTWTAHLDADLVAQLRARGVEPVGVVEPGDGAAEHWLHQLGVRTVLPAEPDSVATRLAAALQRAALDQRAVDSWTGDHRDGETVSDVAGAGAPAADGSAAPGELLAVWGPTGAPGRSTVALGVAAELAATDRSPLLVDADVYGGSLAQMLALLDESSGVLTAARSAKQGALTPSALARHARRVGRLRVLTGLPRADRWPELSEATMEGLLVAARAVASHVVVDCGFSLESDEELTFDTAAPRRNGATLCVLEQADAVVAVGSADPVGIARLARGVVELGELAPGVATTVALNRWRSGLGWSRDELVATVRRLTGIDDVHVLPEDRAACDSCMLHGRTLVESAPRSRLRLAIRELVQAVT